MSFVHLHCHSEYSLLDGANRIDDLIARAQEFEQPALAITDHGNLHAAWEFQEKAKKAGLKPIIGMEAYVAPGDRRARAARATPAPSRTTTWSSSPATAPGYKNLVKLSSLGYTEGFYSQPARRPRAARASTAKGSSSPRPAWRARSRRTSWTTTATTRARRRPWYADALQGPLLPRGAGARLPRGRPSSTSGCSRSRTSSDLPVIAHQRRALPARATTTTRTTCCSCIGLGKDRDDADRMRYDDGLLLQERAGDAASAFPDARTSSTNTLAIADDSATFEFEKKYFLPVVPAAGRGRDDGERPARRAGRSGRRGALRRSAARRRAGAPRLRARRHHQDRLRRLLPDRRRLHQGGARRGIPVGPGRGSAAGSLVAYALRITDVCPLKFDLLFERFLNPGARVDARHRRGLLLRAARRGDRVRARRSTAASRWARSSPSAR